MPLKLVVFDEGTSTLLPRARCESFDDRHSASTVHQKPVHHCLGDLQGFPFFNEIVSLSTFQRKRPTITDQTMAQPGEPAGQAAGASGCRLRRPVCRRLDSAAAAARSGPLLPEICSRLRPAPEGVCPVWEVPICSQPARVSRCFRVKFLCRVSGPSRRPVPATRSRPDRAGIPSGGPGSGPVGPAGTLARSRQPEPDWTEGAPAAAPALSRAGSAAIAWAVAGDGGDFPAPPAVCRPSQDPRRRAALPVGAVAPAALPGPGRPGRGPRGSGDPRRATQSRVIEID